MKNHFKSQLSKLFQSTLNSCRPNTTSDVSDHRKNRRLIDLFSPKPAPQPPSTTKPKPHLSSLGNTPYPSNYVRRSSHSVSPVHQKPSKFDRKKKTRHRKRSHSASFTSHTDNCYYNWWSSDEDDQHSKNTLFSSVSDEFDRKIVAKRKEGGDIMAIAKESHDPYDDFKASMVDMIVEKEIFGVEELENMVECFVSLNSEEHHKVIYDVFAEIWEILTADSDKKDECMN